MGARIRRGATHRSRRRISSNLHRLGTLFRRKGCPDVAEDHYRRAVRTQTALFGNTSTQQVAGMLIGFASFLREQQRYAEADSLYDAALSAHRPSTDATQHPDKERILEGRTRLYDAWGKPQQAAAWRDSLRIARGRAGGTLVAPN